MKPANKEAKFFCESCGSEVPRKSKFCPTCGKFFASVRCPQCGKTGNPEEFKEGCPSCGYAVGKDMNLITGRKNTVVNGQFFKKKKSAGIESGPPVWAYIVSIIVLVILVLALYSCL